ncbi:probable disease resistance protein At4g27220 [Neltuma alba]|uniref:probable disease resistance protein At4g27220 n=1 Tax=Neltuma alba TaxID=207710 RepID=UPI0010A4CF83|nr:probable disease resistance protein At4g27220 [Prosopis alba]
MACPGEGILTEVAKRLLDKTIKEVNYFRHFETRVLEFEQRHNDLDTRREKLQNDIEDARKRNDNQIEVDVKKWIKDADNLVRENTKIKQTWSYGWCPYWQYRQGKRLAQKTQVIKDLIEKCNFERVARPGELPGMRYHASKDFIDFESRKTKFRQLVEALEGGNHSMIGLQGMGGTGKTTLAVQVGKQAEESKAFDKVIFVVVSNPPDVNKIRGEIARSLGLDLYQRVEADHSKLLWSTISDNEIKLLIILDDVWEKLDLNEIGIPFGPDHKNCYVLITTRHSKVCEAMRCHQIVRLHTLADEDALTLFLSHARSNDSEGLAQDFVKECGGLPVAIVALAGALRNWPVGEWNVALTTLRNSKQFIDVDEDLVTVYRCLKLSYDHLNDEKAQTLFLLCSIFPEDYEIPINLIIRLGIGLGIFGRADEYCASRSRALAVKNKLIASSLLLKVEGKECVKMHDLVREVAQWIAKEDIQVITDSIMTLKANKRFVFWSADDFPDQLDGTKLEIVLLWISGNAPVKDPNAFFARMSRLKILFLLAGYGRKFPTPPSLSWSRLFTQSLSQSLLSLKNIHTIILDGWELGDISVLKNLQSLVTLELKNCLIIELPKDIKELQKLRWLGLRNCEIQKNNPFQVIKRCSQLEELYFVSNYNVKDWKPEDDKEIDSEIAADISSSALQFFSIACSGFKCFANDDNGLLKCFNSEHLKYLISEAIFKYLVGRAEVLELGNLGEKGWKSLVPNIIPAEEGGKDNLIKLYLYEWADIECLVDTYKCHYSNLTVFLNLIELHLHSVDVKELCGGAMPSGFLEKLQILKLEGCRKLQNIFLDETLKLPHLKVLKLKDCPMFQPSIFKPSIAQSLGLLEELVVEHFAELKSLIADKSLEEEMRLENLSELRHIFRGPKYILSLPNLQQLDIIACKKLTAIFCVSIVKNLPQLSYLSIKECDELVDIIEECDRDHLHQLCFPELKEINIKCCNSLKFLFSISTCGMFPKLEVLKIEEAPELEQIFICKQANMQKMEKMGEVFPKLSEVILRKLPKFISICEGIDFKDLQCDVEDCPKYREISEIQEEPKNEDSENQATASVVQEFAEITEETLLEIQVKDPSASKKQASRTLAAKSQPRGISVHDLEGEHKTSESTMLLQQKDLVQTKTTKASQKTNVPFDDNSIDIISKERAESGPTSEDVVAATMVADLAPRNSSEALIIPHQKEFPLDLKPSESRSETSMKSQEELADRMIISVTSSVVSQVRDLQLDPSKLVASMEETHEKGSQEDDAAEEIPIIVRSTNSISRKQNRVSSISAQSSEEREKEAVKKHDLQLSMAPMSTNLESIKDTTERGLEENYAEDDVVTAVGSINSDSRKQCTGPIDNLSRKHSALSAKEKEKGIDEKATATDTSPVATPFIRALTVKEAEHHSNVQEEAIIPPAIPSLRHQSQIAYAGTSSPKLGIFEIFKLVELKQGETALLAEALERYPQLLLPREHRTHRIIAWSYRVLVDILVMLATKTPYTITTSEKSTLEANLSEAIVLGFDKDWVESVRAKVFGVDVSDISAEKEEIQAMEFKLGEIDSQLLGLSERRKKLIQNMTMIRSIASAKGKPFGI